MKCREKKARKSKGKKPAQMPDQTRAKTVKKHKCPEQICLAQNGEVDQAKPKYSAPWVMAVNNCCLNVS